MSKIRRRLKAKALSQFDAMFEAIQSDVPGSLDRFSGAAIAFDRMGVDGLAAIPDRLEDENHEKRVMAAAVILLSESQNADVKYEDSIVQRATNVLGAALESNNADLAGAACVMLTHGAIPRELLPKLRKLVRHSDDIIKLAAAIALCSCGAARTVAMGVVRSALASDNPTIAALAASALVRMRVFPDALNHALDALPDLETTAQYGLLRQIALGPTLLPRQALRLAKVIFNESLDPSVRRVAAQALGQVASPEQAAPLLLRALQSTEWLVVDAAVDALDRMGELPAAAANALRSQLRAAQPDMRRAAAKGLKLMGPRAQESTRDLVRQGRRETNIHTLEAMAEALAAIGSSTAPYLFELLKGTDVIEHALAKTALLKMGESACVELAKVLIQVGADETLRRTLLGILMVLFEEAAPAVPIIAAALDATTDDDTVFVALAALFNCAPVAQAAIPAIARRLTGDDDRFSEIAERVLIQMGASAVPALKAARRDARASHRAKLTAVLSRLETGLESRLGYLSKLSPDLVHFFAVVGKIYAAKEGASLKTVERRLKKMKADGRLQGTAFKSISAPTVAAKIRKLSIELDGMVILATSKGTRSKLTENGESLLADVRKYVEWASTHNK